MEGIKSPFEQLPEEVQGDIVQYLLDGNKAEDLAELFLSNMNVEQLSVMVGEVRTAYQDTGDYQHVGKYIP